MATEQFPTDAVPQNGWVLELPGMDSPHFSKLSGLKQSVDTTKIVDGGTNREFYFSAGILKVEPVTMMRARDGGSSGSVHDRKFRNFFEVAASTGAKFNGTMIQYRFGQPVLQIQFLGMLVHEFSDGDFDTESNDKSMQTAVATVDFMEVKYKSEF